MDIVSPTKTSKPFPKPILALQVFALGILLLVVYKNFVVVPFLDYLFGSSTLLLLIMTLLVLGKAITSSERIMLLAIILLFLYAQGISQKGQMLWYVEAAYPLLGFALGLLLLHSTWNVALVRLFGYLALAPFLYGFFFSAFPMGGIRLTSGSNFYAMNRNTIPKLLVMTSAFLMMVEHENEDALAPRSWVLASGYSLLIPFLTVLICFYSRSRAGLLISGALFFMVIVRTLITHFPSIFLMMTKHRWRFLLLLLVLAFVLGVGVLYAYSNSRLQIQGLASNGRREIQLACINELTLKRVLIGYRPEILNDIGLHTSYLNLLVHFGLLSLGFVFLYIRSLYRFLQNSFMFTGLLILWGVYSLVESLSPFAIGDLLIIPLFMLSIQWGRNVSLGDVGQRV
ncbi:MAG TPA: hypothetical protein VJ869_00725 [Sphaerochaeta sp.]|nr:hypothetical protein [Sphaerochaeta sp.]